jgi:hypothetical protein
MPTIPEPEPRPQPTDRLSRIDSKPPLQARNAIARFWVTRSIEAYSTMHRATSFNIWHWSKSIRSIATLGAWLATSIE